MTNPIVTELRQRNGKGKHNSSASTSTRTKTREKDKNANEGKERPPNFAIQIANIAEEQFEFWRNAISNTFATRREAPRETFLIRSGRFRSWLQKTWYTRTLGGKIASNETIDQAISILEAKALFEGCEHPDFVRVGAHRDCHYVFLADDQWQAVEINQSCWRVTDSYPVYFRKSPGMLPLPLPSERGSIEPLWEFLKVEKSDRILVIAWLIQALMAKGPYPILCFTGEQGAGKTTSARVLQRLIDPLQTEARSLPKNEHDLFIGAAACHVLFYDNLSTIPQWMSDAFCRISTGGAFATRKLYTDIDEVIFSVCKPLILTSIADVVNAPDLLERSLIVRLEPLGKSRKAEKVFWAAFDRALPGILCGLLDLFVSVLRELPYVEGFGAMRMADFASLGIAVERALGGKMGNFLDRYSAGQLEAHRRTLEESPIGNPIWEIVQETIAKSWNGTSKQLLKLLNRNVLREDRGLGWPQSARGLSGQIRKLAPAFRALGMELYFSKSTDKDSKRLITFALNRSSETIEGPPSEPSDPSALDQSV